jgi:hypothetical protein
MHGEYNVKLWRLFIIRLVGIVWLGYALDDWRIVIRFPEEEKDFSVLQTVQPGTRAHPLSYSVCIDGAFPGH